LLDGAFAIRDLGDDPEPLSVAEERIPFGANFAIRTIEQRAFRYDPNFGLMPNRRRYDDEIEVITRLLESGAGGYWIPEAMVEHCIGRDRQTVRYIAVYYEAWGETQAFGPTPSLPPRRLFWLAFRAEYGRDYSGGCSTTLPLYVSGSRVG
jgi:hypothetical protein